MLAGLALFQLQREYIAVLMDGSAALISFREFNTDRFIANETQEGCFGAFDCPRQGDTGLFRHFWNDLSQTLA